MTLDDDDVIQMDSLRKEELYLSDPDLSPVDLQEDHDEEYDEYDAVDSELRDDFRDDLREPRGLSKSQKVLTTCVTLSFATAIVVLAFALSTTNLPGVQHGPFGKMHVPSSLQIIGTKTESVSTGSSGSGGGGAANGPRSRTQEQLFKFDSILDAFAVVGRNTRSLRQSQTRSGTKKASLQATDFPAPAFDTSEKQIIEDIHIHSNSYGYSDLTGTGHGFNEVIKFAEMIVCSISATNWDHPNLKSQSKYFTTTVDRRFCGVGTKGNESTLLEVSVRSRDVAGYATLDIYIPGYVGVVDVEAGRVHHLTVYGTLRQEDQGFSLTYELEADDGADNDQGDYLFTNAKSRGFIRYVDETAFYHYAETDWRTRIEIGPDRFFENGTEIHGCSVQNGSALIYQKDAIGTNYSYMITYDDQHVLMQNCTEECHKLEEMPFYVYGDDGNGTCYRKDDYTTYNYHYCLFHIAGPGLNEPGLLLNEPKTFYFDYDPASDLRGDNDLNYTMNPLKAEYYVYPGWGCDIDITRCEVLNDSGNYTSGCADGQNKSESVYNEYYVSTGGYGEGTASLKDSTSFLIDGQHYNMKAMKELRVLKKVDISECGGLTLRAPFWTHEFPGTEVPMSPPYMMTLPENYLQICHTVGTHNYSVEANIYGTPNLFEAQICE